MSEVAAPSQRPRWPLALAFGLTLALVGTLTLVPERQAPIELDLLVREFSFRVPAEQVLTESIALRRLSAAGVARIERPGPISAPASAPAVASAPADAAAGVLALQASSADPECQGTVTLDRLLLPAGARVGVRRQPTPAAASASGGDAGVAAASRLHLVLRAPGAVLRATLQGCLASGGVAALPWRVGEAGTLALVLGNEDADLEIEPLGAAGPVFSPSIRTNGMSLEKVDQVPGDEHTFVRDVSTIASGTLSFPAGDGHERVLRFAERLWLPDVDGVIRSVEPEGDGVRVRFAGTVRGLASGEPGAVRDLMPSLLDGLKAKQGLSLAWGSAIYLFGLLLALAKWWRG